MFINALDEQLWPMGLPLLERLNGALLNQRALRDVVVVGGEILAERDIKVGRAGEAGLLAQDADAAVEAFYHTVGLAVPGLAKPVNLFLPP